MLYSNTFLRLSNWRLLISKSSFFASAICWSKSSTCEVRLYHSSVYIWIPEWFRLSARAERSFCNWLITEDCLFLMLLYSFAVERRVIWLSISSFCASVRSLMASYSDFKWLNCCVLNSFNSAFKSS